MKTTVREKGNEMFTTLCALMFSTGCVFGSSFSGDGMQAKPINGVFYKMGTEVPADIRALANCKGNEGTWKFGADVIVERVPGGVKIRNAPSAKGDNLVYIDGATDCNFDGKVFDARWIGDKDVTVDDRGQDSVYKNTK